MNVNAALIAREKSQGQRAGAGELKNGDLGRFHEKNCVVPEENSRALIRGRQVGNIPAEKPAILPFPVPRPETGGAIQANPVISSFDPSLYFRLLESEMFRDYQYAFEKSTGLRLSLRQPQNQQEGDPPPECDSGSEFCIMMARMNGVKGERFGFQKKLEEEARFESKTLKSTGGLCETAIPVWVGEKLVAFLQTGGVLSETPNRRQFSQISQGILKFSSSIDLNHAEDAYFRLRVIVPKQYEAMIRLISIFATHLATCGSLMVLQRAGPEHPAVVRACQIIDKEFREELSLIGVAGQVNVCAGYFSELFKKATGTNFVEFLATRRVEEAKNLLQNSGRRISDVAFEVGFQSLSQFNRTFRFLAGVSPRAYRASLGNLQNIHVGNMRNISA